MRRIAVIACLLVVSACASPLARLKNANPEANNFPTALASEYQSYAESESEQGHRAIAEHFAEKGMQALEGSVPMPEPLDHHLPRHAKRQLAFARARLMEFLTPDMERVAPQKAARAQLLFDCWQQQLAEHASTGAPCAEEFAAALSDLQNVQDALRYGPENSHVITFARGSATISPQDLATIASVANSLKHKNYYIIELHAYMGRYSVQRQLSQQRLIAVRQALIADGISHRGIRFRKEGSSKAVMLDGSEPLTSRIITIVVKTREH